MVDTVLDVLIEAARELANDRRNNSECPCGQGWGHGHLDRCNWQKFNRLTQKLEALQEQRKPKD